VAQIDLNVAHKTRKDLGPPEVPPVEVMIRQQLVISAFAFHKSMEAAYAVHHALELYDAWLRERYDVVDKYK
jgi:hypothetical protein